MSISSSSLMKLNNPPELGIPIDYIVLLGLTRPEPEGWAQGAGALGHPPRRGLQPKINFNISKQFIFNPLSVIFWYYIYADVYKIF